MTIENKVKQEFDAILEPMLEKVVIATTQGIYFKAVADVFSLFLTKEGLFITESDPKKYVDLFKTARETSPFYQEVTKYER